jgi:uncharacterized membrane protein
MQWHYAQGEQQHGPVEEQELLRLIRDGTLKPGDLVWNPSMGDAWTRVADVPSLSAPPTPVSGPVSAPAPSAGSGGITPNRELMAQARACLSGKWGAAVGATLIMFAISLAAGSVPCLGSIAGLLISGPLTVGSYLFALSVARRSRADVSLVFDGFKRFGVSFAAYLLFTLFVCLWLLLLIVPGIVASLAYSMTWFIIAEDPQVGPLEAIRRSRDMMRGHKGRLFCLSCRFIGWWFLCILTLGIGILWLWPYYVTSLARFYDDLKPAPQDTPDALR